jgi:PhzF family phenazine biosynthesis protein
MRIPIYQVDAFTKKIFGGNPAAVCPLKSWLPEKTLQAIAAENNLSETAFFVRTNGTFAIRWFTPLVEIDLCGHATLASAHVIFEHLGLKAKEVVFRSRKSGRLRTLKKGNRLYLDFPAQEAIPVEAPAALVNGLGRKPREVFKGRDYMALFDEEADVAGLEPDFTELVKLDAVGIIATARGGTIDFVSRFFAPQVGVPEDPVTGSSHTQLIPFWAHRLKKRRLHAYQVSKRGGELFCEHHGDRVLIGGRAVTFMTGSIELPGVRSET